MKPASFNYVAPRTIADALRALDEGAEDARLLAGGQSLVPIMNFRLAKPDLLIDLNKVEELSGIELRDDGVIRIGAMTRHSTVEFSEIVRDYLPMLHAAMPYIAHMQIRNRGTIGGSLAHADPAAEWPALCLAHDASIVVTSSAGRRTIAAENFALGVLTTDLDPQEILTEVLFPKAPANRCWGFQEISRRHGDFALIGVACIVDYGPGETVGHSRISIFGAEDVPILSSEASEVLRGKRLTEKLAREAGEAAAAAISPRADLHASSEYRSQLIKVLVYRALMQAAEQNAQKDG